MPSLSEIKEGVTMSYVLGVTGGIASGKSTVVKVFHKGGFPIVDGDVVAREVVEPNTAGLKALITTFGLEILQKDGQLDRKKLGQIVFADEKKRQQLNQILDPFIRSAIEQQVEEAKEQSALVIVDIPLLFEGHYEGLMDAVAVVYVTSEIQLQRLMNRDGYDKSEALKRINSQLSLEEKKSRGDLVFDNCQSVEKTQEQVIKWLKENNFVS